MLVKSKVSTTSNPLIFDPLTTEGRQIKVVNTNIPSGPWAVQVGGTSVGEYAVQADAESAATALASAVGYVELT